jgi:hypothetical protein
MSYGIKKAAKHRVVADGEEGLYSLVFARCFERSPNGLDESGIEVSFKMNAALLNPGPNFLSACEDMLPVLFLVFAITFAAAAVGWAVVLVKRKEQVSVFMFLHNLLYVCVCVLVWLIAKFFSFFPFALHIMYLIL